MINIKYLDDTPHMLPSTYISSRDSITRHPCASDELDRQIERIDHLLELTACPDIIASGDLAALEAERKRISDRYYNHNWGGDETKATDLYEYHYVKILSIMSKITREKNKE